MAERHAQYIKKPAKLIDIVDYVIKKLSSNKKSQPSEEKILQFNEISKTIERLKESGAPVPDALRKLKIDLSYEVTDIEKEISSFNEDLATLQTMELRLNNSLTMLRANITRLTKGKSDKKKPIKRYVKRTSPKLLRKEIRKALRALGGAAKKPDVLRQIQDNMDGSFKPEDLQNDAKGNPNWKKWVVAERNKMLKEGILKVGSGHGVWELRRK